MTPLLLDTHAWIWLAAGDPRMAKHERAINRAAEARALLLSAISVYEATLIGLETDRGERRGRHAVKMRPTVQQWIRDAIVGTRVATVNLETEVAMDGAALQAMHGDPIDRLIVAQAIRSEARLATADPKILAFGRSAGVEVFEL